MLSMPPSLQEWLPQNHLAWFVLGAGRADGPGGVLRRLPRWWRWVRRKPAVRLLAA